MAATDATPKKADPAWYAVFLAKLAKSPNVSAAAKGARIDRVTAYRHRDSDPAFAAAWNAALDTSVDNLVGEAYRRAYAGVKRAKGVYYEGREIATETVTEYSDTLAIFLLKAHRPEVYRETVRNEMSGPNGGPLVVEGRFGPDAVAAARAALRGADANGD